jgi:uncharacterized membrane protein YccC
MLTSVIFGLLKFIRIIVATLLQFLAALTQPTYPVLSAPIRS